MKDGEHADGTEPTAAQNEARRLAVEATAKWIDSFEGYEGSIVTGYVLIMETQKVGEAPALTWMSGNGVPPDDESDVTEGLAAHRVSGFLSHARLIIETREIAAHLRRIQADDDA